MRTSEGGKKKTKSYSPDDHDFAGFLALIKGWIETDRLSYRERDIEEFCQGWSNYTNVNLRTKRQWLNELHSFVHSDEKK